MMTLIAIMLGVTFLFCFFCFLVFRHVQKEWQDYFDKFI